MRGEWARGVSALILKLMGRGVIVLSARIVIFVVGPAAEAGSATGQSLLGSGKGVGQSSPFTVGNRPCDGCRGDYKMLCEFIGQWHRAAASAVQSSRHMRSGWMRP